MDYKNIIKNRSTRLKILRALDFIPDGLMVRLQYRIRTGRRLHLKSPGRFTEKLQWYKLYYRNPLMKQCVDKYDVRSYVKQCGCGELLNELYGVYNTPEEIDFDRLPESFVLKDTLGGGGNAVILVRDKSALNLDAVKKQMWEWVNTPPAAKHPGREWVYEGRKHRIIAERYVESDEQTGGLIDYKFFCFQGEVTYLYVISDRKVGEKAQFGIFDSDFHQMNVSRVDEKVFTRGVEKPEQFEKMLQIAGRLGQPFPESRIDLYLDKGNIRFGEITFFDGSGYQTFEPDSFDYELGEKFQLKEVWGK
jgi:hypothetical protein